MIGLSHWVRSVPICVIIYSAFLSVILQINIRSTPLRCPCPCRALFHTFRTSDTSDHWPVTVTCHHYTFQLVSFSSVLFQPHSTRKFPNHNKMKHIVDLIITSSDSSLAPYVSMTFYTPSDHFPIFTKLSVGHTPLPLPTFHSFPRIHSIDIDFISDSQSSRLTNHPTSPGSLLISYSIDFSLLYSIRMLQSFSKFKVKLFKRRTKSNPRFTPELTANRVHWKQAAWEDLRSNIR